MPIVHGLDRTTATHRGRRRGRTYDAVFRSRLDGEDEEQRRVAEAYIKQLDEAKVFKKPIVTQVVELKGFYPAEDYHQDFLAHHPDYPYIVVNDLPKLRALKAEFPGLLKAAPASAAKKK